MDARSSAELSQTVAATVAVARLVYLNLAKQFPAIVAYLIFLAGINLNFGLLDPVSNLYFWTYIVLEPFKCVLSILAVRELLALVFVNYPGIRTAGRWSMYAGIAVASGISLAATGFFWSGTATGRAHSHVYYFEVAQRSIVFTLASVIIALLITLSKYPLHLSKNTVVSGWCFSVLFLCEALRLLIDSLAPDLYSSHVDWSGEIFTSVCLLAWATMLTPELETAPARIKFSTPREEHLLRQLDALNSLLIRSARR
jgi:hypothetical protein